MKVLQVQEPQGASSALGSPTAAWPPPAHQDPPPLSMPSTVLLTAAAMFTVIQGRGGCGYAAQMWNSVVSVTSISEISGYKSAFWLFSSSAPLSGQVLCPLLMQVVPPALVSPPERVIASLAPRSQENLGQLILAACSSF